MAFESVSKVLLKIFGSRNERLVKSYSPIAERTGAFEDQLWQLNDEALKAKTAEFKAALAAGKRPEDVLPEAFAVVREAARRNVEMRHFDVQLIGGKVLYEGKIAEMATGEGKTLVATLAAYVVHLTGRHVHIVTVNDYLAKRDSEWMGPVYEALGLTVGAIQADMDTAGQERKDTYRCDITYGTNNEFGFDYLRDNMKVSLEQMVQGPLQYAIVDEVDSILIDEARTPLIISGPAVGAGATRYKEADKIARDLIHRQREYQRINERIAYERIHPGIYSAEQKLAGATAVLKPRMESQRSELADAHADLEKAEDALAAAKEQLTKRGGGRGERKRDLKKAEKQVKKAKNQLDVKEKEFDESVKKLSEAETDVERATAMLEGREVTRYYEVDYKSKAVHLLDDGIARAQEVAGVGSFYTGSNMEWPHLLEQALRARLVFDKGKDYVVSDGKVVIVDEFTGRLMEGRQWSDGLHQAVEAKENVEIKQETQTLATITLQNFFKLYDQLAGMTGTAATEADEFMKIYKLDVVVIPTNKPCVRIDQDDIIYKTESEKWKAVVDEIHRISFEEGRPVLVGTLSVEKSIRLSKMLEAHGTDHETLNATRANDTKHFSEARIVAKAGQQHKDRQGRPVGNITISTNMAGRGTDIKLGPSVADIGGLHVLGTERHESRRIDNQLRGRCGRQGDKGSSQFFLSFDDDLVRTFAPEWTVKALSWIGWEEGEPIYHTRISKGIEKAQKKVEERNFEIRKSLLEYDEVMDYQRKIFYSRRRKILTGEGIKDTVQEMIDNTIAKACASILDKDYPRKCIIEWARTGFDIDLTPSDVSNSTPEEIENLIRKKAKENAANEVALSLGEYLHDYENPQSWDVDGLRQWAKIKFEHNIGPKIRYQQPDAIETQLVSAAADQIDRKDCSQLHEFLEEDFALRRFAGWAKAKFDLKLGVERLKELDVGKIRQVVLDETAENYRRREIEYPVEFAMSMAYGPQGTNVYGFEALAEWARKKYNADLSAQHLQEAKPQDVHAQLTQLSESYNNGRLDEELAEQTAHLNRAELVAWANERFDAALREEDLGDGEDIKARLADVGRRFLRRELADLERYVLVQVYDSTWKDHLYAMDHLKDSIWTRSFAEKDPKVEYKREGFRMFNEMLESIEDRVTDIIFRVHLEAGARAPNVWNVSRTAHDEVGQFAMAERQRAAAQAPQGEQKVKQIRLEHPKVGRNDPCPCGSGKKYKKCHGKDAQ